MSYLMIDGGYPLCGELKVQGSKNAVLPILAACILIDGYVELYNCPDITDVDCMLRILKKLGCRIKKENGVLFLDSTQIDPKAAYEEEAGQMRSSILPAGALLGRFHQAYIRKPGGCSIGERPINIHMLAFEKLGACFTDIGGGTEAKFIHKDAEDIFFTLPYPSVGATENTLLCAVLRPGKTVVHGVAKEPEVEALKEFLRSAGACIEEAGENTLIIHGRKKLNSTAFRIAGDRIAALTYLGAGAITGGEVTVTDVVTKELSVTCEYLKKMGCTIYAYDTAVKLCSPKQGMHLLAIPHIYTGPYPEFPTDMQSQMMSILCLAEGKSVITERIFENRYQTAEELKKMGASINIDGRDARITGTKKLHAAHLIAKELRGGAALMLAAAAAEGTSRIDGLEYIERGYERIYDIFSELGSRITLHK